MRLCILLFTILLVFGCTKEFVQTHSFPVDEHCLTDLNLVTSHSSCSPEEFDTSYYCGVKDTGFEFSFEENQKFWLPAFCCDIGDEIIFTNGKRKVTSIIVKNKYYVACNTYTVSSHCDDGFDKWFKYCYKTEEAYVDFSSSELGFDFRIILNFDIRDIDSEDPNSNISVSIYELDQSGHHVNTFLSNNMEREINDDFHKFHKVMNIHGESFENVHSSTFFDLSSVEMFYNKDYGLLSFIDQSGTQWSIVK